MGTLARGNELAELLDSMGVRATTDPALASPPCVLIIPPNLRFDLACAVDADWQLAALAPAASTADRTTWATLDEMVDAVAKAVDLRTADLVSYVMNGRPYPAYLLSFTEGI